MQISPCIIDNEDIREYYLMTFKKSDGFYLMAIHCIVFIPLRERLAMNLYFYANARTLHAQERNVLLNQFTT